MTSLGNYILILREPRGQTNIKAPSPQIIDTKPTQELLLPQGEGARQGG